MVHTFSALGRNLAVDVNSGAVHVLDEMSYRLLPGGPPVIGRGPGDGDHPDFAAAVRGIAGL